MASLYSVDFYRLAWSRLRRGGYMTQWLPAHQVPAPVLASVIRAFIDVFPDSVLLAGGGTNLILMGRREARPLFDLQAVAARLARLPAVREDLERVEMGTLTELVGSYVGSPRSLETVADGAVPISDDLPAMEYSVVAFLDAEIPPALYDVGGVATFCPGCFERGRPVPLVADLDVYLECMAGYYASPAMRVSRPDGGVTSRTASLALDPATLARARSTSRYLRRQYAAPPGGDRGLGSETSLPSSAPWSSAPRPE